MRKTWVVKGLQNAIANCLMAATDWREVEKEGVQNSCIAASCAEGRPYTRTVLTQGLIYELAKIWNNTSTEIRNSGNLFSLKKQIINSALQSIQPCSKVNCYICGIDSNIDYSERLIKCKPKTLATNRKKENI